MNDLRMALHDPLIVLGLGWLLVTVVVVGKLLRRTRRASHRMRLVQDEKDRWRRGC